MKNIFSNIPEALPDEICQEILATDNLKIERIVSKGHASPEAGWYDQDTNEWVILLKGSATLVFKDSKQSIHLNPGDYINILSHTRHRVEWTDPDQNTVWLAVHY